MPAQDIRNQLHLEPSKFEHVRKELRKRNIEFSESEYEIFLLHNGKVITIYPYSGWFEGKNITPGRGIENLLKQIEL